MPEVKGWNVRRMWWEFTKLLLAGRGGYDVYVRVRDLPDAAQAEFDGENWCASDIFSTDRRDHFVVLGAEPEESDDA